MCAGGHTCTWRFLEMSELHALYVRREAVGTDALQDFWNWGMYIVLVVDKMWMATMTLCWPRERGGRKRERKREHVCLNRWAPSDFVVVIAKVLG